MYVCVYTYVYGNSNIADDDNNAVNLCSIQLVVSFYVSSL